MLRWEIKFVKPFRNLPGDRTYLMFWLGYLTIWIHPEWQAVRKTIWKPGFRWIHGAFFGVRWWTTYNVFEALPMPTQENPNV